MSAETPGFHVPHPSARMRERRSLGKLLEPLTAADLATGNLFFSPLPEFQRCCRAFQIPKYVFIGPPGGGTYQRLGLFGGIHGDEAAGSVALVELLRRLIEDPRPATGYELFVYPVCNPTGYEDDTRWPRGGEDLNRAFWRNSSEPEVLLLEHQLEEFRFDGLVSLHADDTSEGLYGYVAGDVLTRHLLEPALAAAEAFLPRNHTGRIDGWPAERGIIEDAFLGVLAAPPTQTPRPFEIVFETPQLANFDQQVQAHLAALLAILKAHRSLQAHAANI